MGTIDGFIDVFLAMVMMGDGDALVDEFGDFGRWDILDGGDGEHKSWVHGGHGQLRL